MTGILDDIMRAAARIYADLFAAVFSIDRRHEQRTREDVEAIASALMEAEALGAAKERKSFKICGYQRRSQWHVPKGEWTACSSQEATGHFERVPGFEYRPIYTDIRETNS